VADGERGVTIRNRHDAIHAARSGSDYLGLGIDAFSSAALFVVPKFNDTPLGTATGFLWYTRERKHFLVTNWHVLSGRNQENGVCTHSQGGIPNSVTVYFQKIDVNQGHIEVSIPLLNGESRNWIEHPQLGQSVDIAAIEVDVPRMEEANYLAINALPEVALKQRVGHPVFIIGFPFGLQHVGFPVWKKGSFATEPVLSQLSDTYMLVDSASRPGMSGAPVIQRAHGAIELENGSYGRIEKGDGACKLVGVYSGRCHTNDPNDAQLGRVWPIRFVREMLDGLPVTLEQFMA
jgi:hypothetical protein